MAATVQQGAPTRGLARGHPLVAFFALAYALSWLAWLGVGLTGLFAYPLGQLVAVLGAFGPTLAGLALTGALDGRRGVATMLGRLVPWRGRIGWCVVALVGPPCLVALAASLDALLSAAPVPLGGWRGSSSSCRRSSRCS
jgi:uncharacterized protein